MNKHINPNDEEFPKGHKPYNGDKSSPDYNPQGYSRPGGAPDMDAILNSRLIHPEAMPPEDYAKTLTLPSVGAIMVRVTGWVVVALTSVLSLLFATKPIFDAYVNNNNAYLWLFIPQTLIAIFLTALSLNLRNELLRGQAIREYKRLYKDYQQHMKDHHNA